ncbi:DUF1178 family protein [Gymnodinialimonas ceratoperidinii]|uniref:DUF1178 family protein n=1 Tax=Gymnodinialimonas ceratoperidinii TaxID=2856823 RepID=A0A8F6TYK7_9RHOB|nr:DUF1178 family protein [Gymnodinialimonas ceratoperidinii]QXT40828.1 DUF1178 family protein [Gymnodinialimonas ceratoperidinii]
MIRYALKCGEGHQFESWFQSAEAFEGLAARSLLSCAICGGADVSKAMMAPRVTSEPDAPAAASGAVAETKRPLSAPAHPAEAALRALRSFVEKNSTNVGSNFAREARAMHLGDIPEKPIYGQAAPDEAKSLIEDGVPILPLPGVPGDKAN